MTKRHCDMREWRKRERDIGAMVTDSLLSQGFSEGDIARWAPEAWHYVDSNVLESLIDELASHFGDEIATQFLIAATRRQREIDDREATAC
jgi:hypothetical protein